MTVQLENEDLYQLFISRPGSLDRLQKKTKKFKKPNAQSIRYVRYILDPEDKRNHPGVILIAEQLSITLLKEIQKEKEAQAARRAAIAERLNNLESPQSNENAA